MMDSMKSTSGICHRGWGKAKSAQRSGSGLPELLCVPQHRHLCRQHSCSTGTSSPSLHRW